MHHSMNFAPLYPGDEKYSWPHLRFGNDATGRAANPYAMLQKGYKERGRYSATTKVEYIHNLSSVLKGLELREAWLFRRQDTNHRIM